MIIFIAGIVMLFLGFSSGDGWEILKDVSNSQKKKCFYCYFILLLLFTFIIIVIDYVKLCILLLIM